MWRCGAGIAQVVEHDLAKVVSSPTSGRKMRLPRRTVPSTCQRSSSRGFLQTGPIAILLECESTAAPGEEPASGTAQSGSEPGALTRRHAIGVGVDLDRAIGLDAPEGGSRQSQIAVMPPSTGRSTPAMKLASSDARNKAVDAISSGRPSRPNGTAAANWARAWSAPSLVGACWSKIGVSIGPGLIALTRMRRSFNSAVQVRTKERTAALVAL